MLPDDELLQLLDTKLWLFDYLLWPDDYCSILLRRN